MADAILAIVMKLTLAMMADGEATLVFAGDAMMHQAQIDAARRDDGSYDYSQCFAEIAPIVKEADYAVVNLETPLGVSGFSGYPCFNAPVSYAAGLRDAGFDLFLTANNHTLDRRDHGLRHTVYALDSLGIPHVGTYPDSAYRSGALPMIKNVKGFRIGFLHYTYGTNGITVQGDVVVDYIDRNKIADDVEAARKAGAELVVAAMHWGEEYTLLPVKSQKQLADYLLSLGVDMIIGGHPHVVQPFEMRRNPRTGRNALLVYSLGNLISNMKTRDTRGGAIAEVKLKRDSLGVATVSDARYHLVFTVPPSAGQRDFKVFPADSVPLPWRGAAAEFKNALK